MFLGQLLRFEPAVFFNLRRMGFLLVGEMNSQR